jgi:hypothetical protein
LNYHSAVIRSSSNHQRTVILSGAQHSRRTCGCFATCNLPPQFN